MKKILVPSDFSITSREAFCFAADVAGKTNGEVIVLHVVDLPFMYEAGATDVPGYMTEDVWAKVEKGVKEKFEELRGAYKTRRPVRLVIELGHVVFSIKKVTEKEKIDLVVMGTNGSTGIREYFIGSNTEKAVRFSDVPVFVIRKYAPLASIKSIVLPTTRELNQGDFMTRVKELQSLLNATLWLLAIEKRGQSVPRQTRNGLEDFAKHYGLTNYALKVREDDSVEEGIVNFTREFQGDMIAMATHNRKGLAHMFAGSITEDIVNHCEYPIWTYGLRKNH